MFVHKLLSAIKKSSSTSVFTMQGHVLQYCGLITSRNQRRAIFSKSEQTLIVNCWYNFSSMFAYMSMLSILSLSCTSYRAGFIWWGVVWWIQIQTRQGYMTVIDCCGIGGEISAYRALTTPITEANTQIDLTTWDICGKAHTDMSIFMPRLFLPSSKLKGMWSVKQIAYPEWWAKDDSCFRIRVSEDTLV